MPRMSPRRLSLNRSTFGASFWRLVGTLLVLTCCVAAVSGCTHPEAQPAAASIVQPAIELPKISESIEQIKSQMTTLEPFKPAFEEQRLKLLVKWEEIRTREGVDGFSTPPLQPSNDLAGCVDPATGQIAWRAM